MCVQYRSEVGLVFLETVSIWEVTCLALLKKWTFSYLCSLDDPINVMLKPSEQGSFFDHNVNLRGHMPRFTTKNECLLYLSPYKPHKCVLKPLWTGFCFSRWSIWGVTCLGLILKWMFSHLDSLDTPVNVCWNPQNRDRFSNDDNWFEGSHA